MNISTTNEPWKSPDIIKHSRLLAESYLYWTGQSLIDESLNDLELAYQLYHHPVLKIVSHNTEKDPVFNYANLNAQRLWNMDWESFTKMPSRLSAEPMVATERQRLLDEAAAKGFISDYTGVRISSDGQRFKIINTLLWNVVDKSGNYTGQAAAFKDIERI